MPTKSVMITGASSSVGYETVKRLLSTPASSAEGEEGLVVKAMIHLHGSEEETNEEEKLRELEANLVLIEDHERQNPKTFEGVDALFLIPPEVHSQQILLDDIIQAASKADVKFILSLGHLSAGKVPATLLGEMTVDTEERIKRTAIPHCFLRSEILMDLHLADSENLKRTSAFYYPVDPDTKFNTVAACDLAEMAAKILLDPRPHFDKVYTITGPRPLSMTDMAEVYSRVLHKDVKFLPANHRNAVLSFQGRGMNEWFSKALVEVMEKLGMYCVDPIISQDGPALLGRHMTSFEEFVLRNQQHFSGSL